MRHTGLLAAAAVLVSGIATADVVRHKTIPESFVGTWALAQEDCNQPDKPVIVLSAASYSRLEAKCAVLWVTETAARRGPVFSAHLQCSTSNGSRKTTSNFLLLKKDDNQISAGADFGSLKTYQRCPAGAPATTR